MKRKFKVQGCFDGARPSEGTVTIDEHGLFRVRPKRRRREFILPLSTVADMTVQRVVKAEVFAARVDKAKRKRKRK